MRGPRLSSPSRPEETSKVVNIQFDDALLARIDADALRLGISRTAWLRVAANGMLERAKIEGGYPLLLVFD